MKEFWGVKLRDTFENGKKLSSLDISITNSTLNFILTLRIRRNLWINSWQVQCWILAWIGWIVQHYCLMWWWFSYRYYISELNWFDHHQNTEIYLKNPTKFKSWIFCFPRNRRSRFWSFSTVKAFWILMDR